MNYKVIYIDYVQNGIEEVKEHPDEDLLVYKSISKAKKKLLWFLYSEIKQIKERILDIKENKF